MRSLALAAAFCTVIALRSANGATLEESFRNPPDTARPWVYWTCLDGHYSLEGATRDLESMKQAGIGGILRMDCNVGIPFGGTPYLSDAWCKQFVHTVHECERLGLEFATITGPGWTGTGGPWIKVEQSMQDLVPASVVARGPARFNEILRCRSHAYPGITSGRRPRCKRPSAPFTKTSPCLRFPVVSP